MSFNYTKGFMMLEFKAATAKAPTLADVKKQFDLADDEIDGTFGLVPFQRPEGTTYVAIISADAGWRLEKKKPAGFVQNWSNGPIGPA